MSLAVVLAAEALAGAAPTVKVAVATFASKAGAVTADEVADRLSLATGWAIVDREHVRDAERALKWSGGVDDPQQLVALGKRLKVDVVIGGSIDRDGDGKTLRLRLVEPAGGKENKLEVKAARARGDLLAIEACKATLAARKGDAPGLARAALESVDGAGNDKAYDLYAQAREKYFAGDFAGARAGLEAAVKLDGKMGRALALQAMAAIKLRDYAGAEAPAKAGLDASPGLREVRLAHARAQDYNERIEAAIDAYKNVLAAAGEDAVAHSNLARLLGAKKRDHAAAARELQAAVEDEPAWSLPAFNLAQEQLTLGRAADAVAALERLHEDEPANDGYARTLARALRYAGRPSAAIPIVQPIAGKAILSRVELALAQAEAGMPDEALKTLDEAKDKSALVTTARARVLLSRKDAAGAVKTLEEGRAQLAGEKSALDRHELLKTLGVAQLERGKPTDAAAPLKQVVDEDPLDAEALYDLGLALAAAHDGGAQAVLEKAQAAAPWMVPAAVALGAMKLAGGEAAQAAQVYKKALSAGADDARLRLGLGVALWRSGALDDAVGELKLACASPRTEVQAEAEYDLAEALWAAHKREDARAAAQKYLTLETRAGHDAQKQRAALLAK